MGRTALGEKNPLLQHTFRVFDAQLPVHKPLRGRAAAMTCIVLAAAGTGSSAHLTVVVKEHRVLPDLPEALRVQITRLKLRGLEEGARIDLALGANTARSRRSSAYIEACQHSSKGVEMEEGIRRQYIGVRG